MTPAYHPLPTVFRDLLLLLVEYWPIALLTVCVWYFLRRLYRRRKEGERL
jgi:hypothetical protein